jgi:hypothetical protein
MSTGERTTHTLTRTKHGEWELRSDHGHKITKLLTIIRAATPDAAMVRANLWLDTHVGEGVVLGDYWARSRGYTDRWALRISRRHADRMCLTPGSGKPGSVV